MNRIFLSVGALGVVAAVGATFGAGCTKVETLPPTYASVDSAVAMLDASIMPYDAALHAAADSAVGAEPACLRATASAAQASDVGAFGYHAPMAARAACTDAELAALGTASGAAAFKSLQYHGTGIAGVGADCASCLMAEYDATANPAGASAQWGISGMRLDAAETSYVLPSNRSWLNTFGCLQRANLLSAAEAEAASNAQACRALFCPLGSGGCGQATSQEYAACTQAVEAPSGSCGALAALVTPEIAAKLDAAKASGACADIRAVGAAFCGGAQASAADAGSNDASAVQ